MNPRSQDVLKVIRNFEKVLPMATRKDHLNMGVCPVIYKDQNHACGTIHCVGGWYMISKLKEMESDEYIGFSLGVKEMEKDLGFHIHLELSDSELMVWAKDNPKIWGNESGYIMFGHECAYLSESRPGGAKNLTDVIDHWKEVYQRLLVIEAKATPPVRIKYVSIPESLAEQVKEVVLS